jgi:hypothetical protein
MVEGMSIADAHEQVNKVYGGNMRVAISRVKTFDTLLKKKFEELAGNPPIPNLLTGNPDRLDLDGICENAN